MVGGSDHFVVELEPDPRDLADLEARLSAAAVAAVGAGDEEEFGVFLRNGGTLVAGASGTFWGGCCQVHTVWVDETRRGHGVARALMTEVEQAARQHGCRLVMGLTYEVLTGDLYDRLGYRVVGALEDCPVGTTTRWYCKDV